jgi:hypothetical protein
VSHGDGAGKFPELFVAGLQVFKTAMSDLTYSYAKAYLTIMSINSWDFKTRGIVPNFRTMLTGKFFPEIKGFVGKPTTGP